MNTHPPDLCTVRVNFEQIVVLVHGRQPFGLREAINGNVLPPLIKPRQCTDAKSFHEKDLASVH